MMQYEKDFIYKVLPNLTKAVNHLADELKRYNDHAFEVAAPDVSIKTCDEIIPIFFRKDDDIPNDVLQRYNLPLNIKKAYASEIEAFLLEVAAAEDNKDNDRDALLKLKIDFTSSPHINPSRLSDILISYGYCDAVYDSNGADHWTYFCKDEEKEGSGSIPPLVMFYNSDSFELVLSWSDYWEKH